MLGGASGAGAPAPIAVLPWDTVVRHHVLPGCAKGVPSALEEVQGVNALAEVHSSIVASASWSAGAALPCGVPGPAGLLWQMVPTRPRPLD